MTEFAPSSTLLADQTRLLRAITDNADLALFIMDERQHCVFMNPAAEVLTGFRVDEVRDRPLHDVIHHTRLDGSPYPLDECPIDQAFPTRNRMKGEEVFVHRDGHFYDVAFTASPIRAEDGGAVGTVIEVQDITAQKHADDMMRANEAQLASMFAISTVGMAQADPSTRRFVRANAAFCRVTGYTERELRDVTVDDLTHPEDRARDQAAYDSAIRGGGPYEIEKRYVRRDGSCVWVQATGNVVRNRDGRPVRAFAVVLDITQRKHAEQALRESEERFRTMADSSPVMVWVTDTRGNIEFVNRAYLAFFGIPVERLQGLGGWRPLVHPDDVESYVEPFLRAVRDRTAFGAECRVRVADGSWRWIASYATPRFSDTGEFLGHVGSSPDITDRKHAEEALREADRRKDEFLAVLAHELRNPLAPIRTGIELLRLAPGDPVAMERVRGVLERQVSHMVRLVDDLLDVSRITSGKIHLQRQAVALAELVQNAVEANRSAIHAAGLALEVDLPPEPVTLDADPTRFVQVLSNLLHNAAKFSDRSGTITISARLHDDGAAVALTVADTGIGIAPEMLPRIFDLFVQAGTGPRNTAGLGIGLALARQLTELHGGQIEARSDGPGHGSAFTIRMPVVRTGARQHRHVDGATPKSEKRVLVVDDNIDAADMLAGLVRALGAHTEIAYDGESALHRAEAFRPDVVLLDIGMPGMDGYETCRRLRADGSPDAYIVAITGWGQQQDKERALRAGFDGHVTKPADPAVVRRILATAPNRSRAG